MNMKTFATVYVLAVMLFGGGFGCLSAQPTTCSVGQDLFWDDGFVLHPTHGDKEPSQTYRCAQSAPKLSCTNSFEVFHQDLIRHLHPGPGAPGELVRCVGPRIRT